MLRNTFFCIFIYISIIGCGDTTIYGDDHSHSCPEDGCHLDQTPILMDVLGVIVNL